MPQRPPPPIKQLKDDNCTLARLRSLLAQRSIDIDEPTLEILANKQAWGVTIEDLDAAARHLGLETRIERLNLAGLHQCLMDGVFPIVFLNRVHSTGVFKSREDSPCAS